MYQKSSANYLFVILKGTLCNCWPSSSLTTKLHARLCFDSAWFTTKLKI